MRHRLEHFLRRDLWVADLHSLRGFQRVSFQALRLLVAVVREFRERVLDARAAGLVYSTLLSLVPFLAVTISVLKAFGVHLQVVPILAQALEPLGPKGQEITSRIVIFVENLKVGVLGAVGVAALFYTTYSLIDKVEEALNAIWGVPEGRSWARKFTDYLSVVLVGPVLVFTAFALIASAQSHWLVQRLLEVQPLGYVVVWATQFMPFVLLCAVFTFVYKFVPYTRVQFASALTGGITAGLLWQIASWAFATFVAESARYSAIYSGFAILILFLIWLYLSWLIVLVGAQVAFFHQNPSAYQSQVAWRERVYAFQEWLALALLLSITRKYLVGAQPYRLTELAGELQVPPSIVAEVVSDFVRNGILCLAAEPEGVTLFKSPELISVTQVLDVVRRKDVELAELPAEPKDPIAQLLKRRDQAVELALRGVSLKTFVQQAEMQASAPELTAPALNEELTEKLSPQ